MHMILDRNTENICTQIRFSITRRENWEFVTVHYICHNKATVCRSPPRC